MEILTRAWREATARSDREHVTSYIWRNPQSFQTVRVELREDLSHFRLTVDNEADEAALSRVIEALEPADPLFGVYAATDFLKAHPEIVAMNAGVRRQEQYWRQVAGEAAGR
jgi:spore coat polysaccharide biosynthesis protein SpsF